MNQIQKELEGKSRQLRQALEKGINWVTRNLKREEIQRVALRLKENRSLARDLVRISPHKPTVGVYGPSQVGKSYLMSQLFRSPEGKFYLEFQNIPSQFQEFFEDGKYLDYIRYVNPTGGKESSGVVTRFTLPSDAPTGEFPIPVEFLSQVELALILIDTFTLDITDSSTKIKITQEELSTLLGELRQKMGREERDGLEEDDLVYFKNYLSSFLEQNPIFQQIQQLGLWWEIIELIPRLDYRSRLPFFSLFWGKVPVFDQLFLRLSEVLAKLNFSRKGYLGLDALLPKAVTIEGETLKSSVIDVGTVGNLFQGKVVKHLEVKLPDGKKVRGIDIAEITGVVREMTLPVDQRLKNDPLRQGFKEVDVYDFPGARVRKRYILEQYRQLSSLTDEKASSNDENILHESFVRGKVNFLFNYYSYINDITTLYLALRNGNQEVNTLPRQIDQWILSNYGESPESRKGKPVNLLISFHFFNVELDGKPSLVPGEGNIEQYNELWEIRFREHIEKWLASQTGRPSDNWIENWANGNPFQNFYFLRDPNYGRMTIIENGKEKFASREFEIQNREMAQSFISTPIVRKYLPNPEEVWEKVATPGNTGVEMIIEGIFKVTTWERRREQILGRIGRIAQEAYRELEPFYQSGDWEEEHRKVLEKTKKTLLELTEEVLAERNRFGELLYLLSMKETTPYNTLYYILNPYFQFDYGEEGLKGRIERGIEVENKIDIDLAWYKKILGLEELEVKEESLDKNEEVSEESRQFVARVLEEWQRRVEEETPQKLEEIGISPENLQWILQVLRESLERVGLRHKLEQEVDPFIKRFVENEQVIYLISRLTLLYFNRLVESVGWSYVSPEQRPQLEETPIFREWDPDFEVIPPDFENLNLKEKFPGRLFTGEWLLGFKEGALANLKWKWGKGGGIENPEENKKLREILEELTTLSG